MQKENFAEYIRQNGKSRSLIISDVLVQWYTVFI